VLHIDRNDIAVDSISTGWWGVGEFVALTCLGESANLAHGRLRPSLIQLPPPPAAVLIQDEWVQRDLPAAAIAVAGRSEEARCWLQNTTANNGLVVSWVFGPDQANLRDDVDGFQLLVRRHRHYPQVLLPQATLLNILIHGLSPLQAGFGPTPIRTNVVQ
jgi:hypothetical protein